MTPRGKVEGRVVKGASAVRVLTYAAEQLNQLERDLRHTDDHRLCEGLRRVVLHVEAMAYCAAEQPRARRAQGRK